MTDLPMLVNADRPPLLKLTSAEASLRKLSNYQQVYWIHPGYRFSNGLGCSRNCSEHSPLNTPGRSPRHKVGYCFSSSIIIGLKSLGTGGFMVETLVFVVVE